MNNVIIFGTAQFAEVAYFYLTYDSQYTVSGFTVDAAYQETDTFCGLPVRAFDELDSVWPPAEYMMLIAVGYTKMNTLRQHKCVEAKAKGYRLISYVSSKATVWPGLQVGENCFILEDNTIQPFVHIGNNVTLWSGNHIGHHAQIGENCFIASHVVVSGGVCIKNNCFIGVNATLRNHITIAENSVIGAGALILENTETAGVYTGQPAKKSRVPSFRLKKI